MRQAVLSVSLMLAIGLFVLQLPGDMQATIKGKLQYAAAAAGLTSLESYGVKLAVDVDLVVKNIHARIPGSKITHTDILTVMCMESAGLVGKRKVITSTAGARGLTQVMPGTLKDFSRTRRGGFYLPNRPDLLYRDSRFSVEAGALIFNYHLMKYIPRYSNLGGRRAAAIAYNGGGGRVGKSSIPAETYKYAYQKLPHCYNRINKGISPVNSPVWRAMIAKTSELTGGKMSLAGAPGLMSDIPSLKWAPSETASPVQSIGQKWWGSPQGQTVQQGGGATQQQQRPPQQTAEQRRYEQQKRDERYRESKLGRDRSSWVDKFIYKTKPKEPDTIQASQAELVCDVVDSKLKLRWSCPSGTTVSSGSAPKGGDFETHGASAGSVRSSNPLGKYFIECLKGHELLAKASCTASGSTIQTTVLGDSSLPKGVVMTIEYDEQEVTWATLGTKDCAFNLGFRHSEGTGGSLEISEMRHNALAELTCDTNQGRFIKRKEIVVE